MDHFERFHSDNALKSEAGS